MNLDDATVSLISFNDFVIFCMMNLALGCACRRKTERWKLMTSEPASSPWDMTWYGDTDMYGWLPTLQKTTLFIFYFFATIHILAKLRHKIFILNSNFAQSLMNELFCCISLFHLFSHFLG